MVDSSDLADNHGVSRLSKHIRRLNTALLQNSPAIVSPENTATRVTRARGDVKDQTRKTQHEYTAPTSEVSYILDTQ